MEKKMMRCAVLAFGLMVLVLNATASPPVENDLCQEAVKALMPCLPFLTGSGPAVPSSDCCGGAQSVLKQATTSENRKALCQCFKNSGRELGVKPDKAERLPELCKINVPVPIKPDVDCSKLG